MTTQNEVGKIEDVGLVARIEKLEQVVELLVKNQERFFSIMTQLGIVTPKGKDEK